MKTPTRKICPACMIKLVSPEHLHCSLCRLKNVLAKKAIQFKRYKGEI